MIGSLRGILIDRRGGEVIVEVNGIGYRLTATPATVAQMGEPGSEVFLHVHHYIREDSQTLYGFSTGDERWVFEALISAHGVGPALALAIQSVHHPDGLRRLLADDDIDALCLVPGVGKKTAARLLVELKSKLELPDLDLTRQQGGASGEPSARAEVREALAGLGYGAVEISEVVQGLPAEGDTSELLKDALQRLAVA